MIDEESRTKKIWVLMATLSKQIPILTNNYSIGIQTGLLCHKPKLHLELLDTLILHKNSSDICHLVYKAGLVPGKQPQLDSFDK
jgi:hypothetical protein